MDNYDSITRVIFSQINLLTESKGVKYARSQKVNKIQNPKPFRCIATHFITTVASADISSMKAVQLAIGFCAVSTSWAFTAPASIVHATRACEKVNVGVAFQNPTLTLAAATANSNALEGIGSPSNPGWESGRLNRLTEWADSSVPNRPIICEYQPEGSWLPIMSLESSVYFCSHLSETNNVFKVSHYPRTFAAIGLLLRFVILLVWYPTSYLQIRRQIELPLPRTNPTFGISHSACHLISLRHVMTPVSVV